MKKLIIFYVLLGFFITGCHRTNQNLNSIPAGAEEIEKEKIEYSADNYKNKIVKPNFRRINLIRQLTIDELTLEPLLTDFKSIKLLTGYDNGFTIYIDFIDMTNNHHFYDIKDPKLGIASKICTPNFECDFIQDQKSDNPDELKEDSVDQFSKNYIEEILKDKGDTSVIREINFDASKLKALLNEKRLGYMKLIPAAYKGPDDKYVYTLILQFNIGRDYYYYKASDPKTICPPPYPCEISK